MPNIRPIQNAAGDAAEFLNAALRGTNLREQMAEAVAREKGLNTAMRFDSWTTPTMGVDTFPLTPDYAVPIGRQDYWLHSQPGLDRKPSAFINQMGSGSGIDPQIVIGGSSAHKLPSVVEGADLGGMEERALATLATPAQVIEKPIFRSKEPPQVANLVNDSHEGWGGWDDSADPQITMAELAALHPVEDDVVPSSSSYGSSASAPTSAVDNVATQNYISSLPDLGVPSSLTQGVQGILPGILIPENASPTQQFTEGLRRGFTKQIGEEGHYSQSIFSSPPRPQDETDLGLLGKTGVVLGALGGDLTGHGTRKFFWNVQPEDVTGTYGKKFLEGVPRVAQLAGSYGATLALGVGSGILDPTNLAQGGRPAGYEAASADPDDPRQSTNPLYDLVIQRGLLGRKGRLLPWEQFHEERPDVDYQKYSDYKDYMFNKNPDLLNKVLGTATLGLVKANADGINGPELSVMGYGVTPLGAAAALGTLGAVAAGAKRVAALR